jgi:hypothetical protein
MNVPDRYKTIKKVPDFFDEPAPLDMNGKPMVAKHINLADFRVACDQCNGDPEKLRVLLRRLRYGI